MPSRARRGAPSRVTSMSRKAMLPAEGRMSPMIVLISVVLPTPFRPISATISPVPTVERDVGDDLHPAIAGADRGEAELRHGGHRLHRPEVDAAARPRSRRPRRSCPCANSRPRWSTLVWASRLADEGHVVLDHHHGHAVAVDLADDLRRPLGLLAREARGRLVEEEQFGLGRPAPWRSRATAAGRARGGGRACRSVPGRPTQREQRVDPARDLVARRWTRQSGMKRFWKTRQVRPAPACSGT